MMPEKRSKWQQRLAAILEAKRPLKGKTLGAVLEQSTKNNETRPTRAQYAPCS
jgi:hypothetical protein